MFFDADGNPSVLISVNEAMHILIRQPDGTFIEVDRNNAAIGRWVWNEDADELFFLEFEVMPLAMWRFDDETGEWLYISFADMPFGWWDFDDENGEIRFNQFDLLSAGHSPETGDSLKGVYVAAIIMLLSLAGFAFLMIFKKRWHAGL
jgi:LPXTG-motif cell wall-anchored protein